MKVDLRKTGLSVVLKKNIALAIEKAQGVVDEKYIAPVKRLHHIATVVGIGYLRYWVIGWHWAVGWRCHKP